MQWLPVYEAAPKGGKRCFPSRRHESVLPLKISAGRAPVFRPTGFTSPSELSPPLNCGCFDVAAPLAVSAKRVTDKESRDEARFARPLCPFSPNFRPTPPDSCSFFHKFLISRIYLTKFSVNFCPLFTNLRMEKEKILQSYRAGDILNLVKRKENIAITEYRAGPPAMSKPYITSNEQRVDSAMGCPSHSACLLSFCFIHRVRPAGWVAPQRKTIDNVIFTGGCLNGLFTDCQ